MSQEKKKSPKGIALKSLGSKLEDIYYERKLSHDAEDFKRVGEKTEGVSSGFTAERNKTGDTVILKTAEKGQIDFFNIADFKKLVEKGDDFREFLMGDIYNKILLRGASPEINIIDLQNNLDSPSNGAFAVESKFLKNFKTYYEFREGSYVYSNRGGEKLDIPKSIKEIEKNNKFIVGFEKLVAGLIFGGEVDYHGSNWGVIKELQEDGRVINKAVKIDHGRSDMTISENPLGALIKLSDQFKEYDYRSINFNISKFREHLEMITKTPPEEFDKFIDRGLDRLDKIGFDPREIKNVEGKEISIDWDLSKKGKYNSVSKLYKKSIRSRIKTFESVVGILKEIEKIDAPDLFKNSGWLETVAEISKAINGANISPEYYADIPVLCALEKDYKINGNNAVRHCLINSKTINNHNIFGLMSKGSLNECFKNEIIDLKALDVSFNEEKEGSFLAHKFSYLLNAEKNFNFENFMIESGFEKDGNNSKGETKYKIKESLKEEDVFVLSAISLSDSGVKIGDSSLSDMISHHYFPKDGLEFGYGSEVSDVISRSSPEFLAQKIEDITLSINTKDLPDDSKIKDTEPDIMNLLKNLPPKDAKKLLEASRIAQYRKEAKKTTFGSMSVNIMDCIRNIGNMFSRMSGRSVEGDEVSKAFSEMANFSMSHRSDGEDISLSKAKNLKNLLESKISTGTNVVSNPMLSSRKDKSKSESTHLKR
jgi:hypothetical protein